jgi:hypothetical protein
MSTQAQLEDYRKRQREKFRAQQQILKQQPTLKVVDPETEADTKCVLMSQNEQVLPTCIKNVSHVSIMYVYSVWSE